MWTQPGNVTIAEPRKAPKLVFSYSWDDSDDLHVDIGDDEVPVVDVQHDDDDNDHGDGNDMENWILNNLHPKICLGHNLRFPDLKTVFSSQFFLTLEKNISAFFSHKTVAVRE